MTGERLRKLRMEADISLGEAARKIGVSLSLMSEWERGCSRPSEKHLGELAAALGRTLRQVEEALPTEQEIEEHAGFVRDTMEKLSKGLEAVQSDAKAKGYKQGNGGRGSLKCPCCADGTLSYSVASCNGHIWGACSTKECVRWMQ